MAKEYEWDQGLLSAITVEFDRALNRLRRDQPSLNVNPDLVSALANQLMEKPGITRREFDRRFRLIISTITETDPGLLRGIVTHLRTASPAALNAVRTLLPAELRHIAIQPRSDLTQLQSIPLIPSPASIPEIIDSDITDRFSAVALIGTPDEHVRNEALLKSADLTPLRLPSLKDLLNLASTGLCGFVIGRSAWSQIPESDQPQTIRHICEYSTFLFVRICVDGLSPETASTFASKAEEARCGILDGKKFCHGQGCELTLADVDVLRVIAQVLKTSATADFFPLGLSESDISLLRLIAADRRPLDSPLTIRRLGTRELAGGRSGARVFLLNDGSAQPFVAKVDRAERLTSELRRYQQWIQNWEPNVTNPTFHAHLKSAAISYRLHAAPDADGHPAPTLEDSLEGLRSAEWLEPDSFEKTKRKADDLFLALSRAIDRLATLNSKKHNISSPDDEFWLDWPVSNLAKVGIDITVLDHAWRPILLSKLVEQAVCRLRPHLTCGVVHGDIHGRNILLLDRLPVFIDFALSGPGHPLVDLVRLDAVVRSAAMRMILDKRSMHAIFQAIYVDGSDADLVLSQHSELAKSPLTALAIRTSIKVREAALKVAESHALELPDFYAMTCVVSGHVLTVRNPGSGIERLLLSSVGSAFLGHSV